MYRKALGKYLHNTQMRCVQNAFSRQLQIEEACLASAFSTDSLTGLDHAESSTPKRYQLMVINGYITSGPYTLPSRDSLPGEQSHKKAGAQTGRTQLLMGSDGLLRDDVKDENEDEDGDTSEGTSSDDDDSESTFTSQEASILEAALQHVKEEGWSVAAVRRGAQDQGLSPAAAAKFERPQAALVLYFVGKCNKQLSDKLETNKRDLLEMKMSDRIQTAVQWRLEMIIPYMSNWGQALAIQTSPGSLPASLEMLSKMVDDIWYACGDTSADFSWYSKRATLAGIYAATEAFMLTDYSPGYADTWEALGRRMQDVAQFGKLQKEASQKAKKILGDAMSKFRQAMGQMSNHRGGL